MVRAFLTLIGYALTLCAFAGTALADARLALAVHPNYGTIDDLFILSVTLEDGPEDTPAPLLSGGGDFNLTLLGPASSLQIINGKVSRRVSYNYELTPKREGILNTPGAEITIDGRRLTASPLQITVRGARSGSAQSDTQPEDADYFMRQQLSNADRVYVGQQLTHTLEIFTRATLIDPQLKDLTFPNFKSETFGEQENHRRFLNGVPYTVSVLRRALFPQAAGTIQIAARELKARVRGRGTAADLSFDFGGMDPFDPNFIDNFFTRGTLRAVTLRSNPLTVEVKPLPLIPTNLPLMGLDTPPVGPTAVRVSYDQADLRYGETKTVTVSISSAGNIQGIKSLGLKDSASIKIYEESPQTKSTLQGDLLFSTRSFKLSIVPLGGDSVQLPAIALGYFDPQDGSFKTANSEAIRFSVVGAPALAQARGAETSTQPSEVVQQQENATAVAPAREQAMVYREPSRTEALLSRVSLPLALLALAAVLLLAGAVLLGIYLRRRTEPKRALGRQLAAAQAVHEIPPLINRALRRSYPNLPEQFSRDELRRVVVNKQLLFQIEALLDALDGSLFGRDSSSLPELKSLAATVLEAL